MDKKKKKKKRIMDEIHFESLDDVFCDLGYEVWF